jgi:mannose-6-phosphate isomerase-like protein (cupin superfamily)
VVVGEVNDHDIKIAVNEDPTEWHHHSNSAEFFFTLEGSLTVEFRDGRAVVLNAGEGLVVEAGAIHRTIPSGRTVNLLVEHRDITTTFETQDGGSRKGSSAQVR